jgi:hypothetical protein
MQVMRTSFTPRYAVAASRTQRDGTQYQAPSILTIARELISTGIGLRTSKLVAGTGSAFFLPQLADGSACCLPGRERRVEVTE